MPATKRFKNTSDRPQKFQIWSDPNMAPHEYDVAPGEECEIPNGYAGNFVKRRAPGLTACDELPSDDEQARLDDIDALAKEAEELAKLEAEELAKLEAEELAKLEAEELAKLEAEELAETAETAKEEGLFKGLGKEG